MLLRNLDWHTTEWLINNKKATYVERSSAIKINSKCALSPLPNNYYDWLEYTQEVADFYDKANLLECLRGYNVEVSSIDDSYPEEILQGIKQAK